MDKSCGKCFDVWKCSWCKNCYCDDVCCPYVLEGKPIKVKIDPYLFLGLTEKEIKKRKKYYEELSPKPQNFYLCNECKDKYIENNVCKGRRKSKIGQNKTSMF